MNDETKSPDTAAVEAEEQPSHFKDGDPEVEIAKETDTHLVKIQGVADMLYIRSRDHHGELSGP